MSETEFLYCPNCGFRMENVVVNPICPECNVPLLIWKTEEVKDKDGNVSEAISEAIDNLSDEIGITHEIIEGNIVKTPCGDYPAVVEEGKLGIVIDYDLTFIPLEDLEDLNDTGKI